MQSGTHRPQCSEDRPGLGPPGWQLSFLCFSRGLCGLSQGGSWSLSMSMDASRREVNVPGLRTARDRAPKPIESSPPPLDDAPGMDADPPWDTVCLLTSSTKLRKRDWLRFPRGHHEDRGQHSFHLERATARKPDTLPVPGHRGHRTRRQGSGDGHQERARREPVWQAKGRRAVGVPVQQGW